MTLSRQTEVDNCSFVKSILMLMVVLYHSTLYYAGESWFIGKTVEIPAFRIFVLWSHSFRMYGFTLVAGYLYFYLRYEREKYQEFIPFLKNKIRRLIIPFVFISTVWIVPISIYFFQYDAKNIFIKFVLATSPSQLWFLWMLFDVFVIVWWLSDWFYKHNLVAYAISLLFVIIGIVGSKVLPNVFCIWTGFSYIIYFLLGFKIRQYGSSYLKRVNILYWIIAHVSLFALVKYLSNYKGIVFKALHLSFMVLLQIIGGIMAFLVLQKLASCFDWQNNKLLQAFTKKSMAIFLLHQQIIYFTITAFNGKVNPYMNALINFMVAIGGAYLISSVLFKSKMLRMMMGEKN